MKQDMMSCVIAVFIFITIYTVRQGQKDTSLTKKMWDLSYINPFSLLENKP